MITPKKDLNFQNVHIWYIRYNELPGKLIARCDMNCIFYWNITSLYPIQARYEARRILQAVE